MYYRLSILLILPLFFTGCGSTSNPYQQRASQLPPKEVVTPVTLPPIRRTYHTIKKVEDTNFSDSYMYPQTKSVVKKEKVTPTLAVATPETTTPTVQTGMTKVACIAMLGEEKFNKYTQMFGSEAASIKRCTMLQAMTK